MSTITFFFPFCAKIHSLKKKVLLSKGHLSKITKAQARDLQINFAALFPLR